MMIYGEMICWDYPFILAIFLRNHLFHSHYVIIHLFQQVIDCDMIDKTHWHSKSIRSLFLIRPWMMKFLYQVNMFTTWCSFLQAAQDGVDIITYLSLSIGILQDLPHSSIPLFFCTSGRKHRFHNVCLPSAHRSSQLVLLLMIEFLITTCKVKIFHKYPALILFC